MSTKSEWECRKVWFFYFLIKLFAFPLPKSLEKLTLFSNNLFPFSLCLALFSESFLLSFFLSVVFGQPANEGKTPTKSAALCWFSPVFLLKTLIWKSCSCCFSHFPFQHFIWVCTRPFRDQSLICQLWGPVSSQYEPSLFLFGFSCFRRSTTEPQNARGNTQFEALRRRWRKEKPYLAMCSAINPIMAQLPLSKRSEGSPTCHHTTLG